MESASSNNIQHQIFQGDVFSAIITHVANHEEFYVVKTESTAAMSEMQECLAKKSPDKMFWYPAYNEKFLINIENEYFRAKRVVLTEETKQDSDYMQTFLIDTGETFLVPMHNLDPMDAFFVLPGELVEIPSLARKCKWIESGMEDDKGGMFDFLRMNIFKNILTFEAVKVRGETAFTKIYPYEEEQEFVSDDDEIVEAFEETLNIADENQGKDIFTADEINELYEEPLDTNNALIAVQGYSTKEDERFCRFYDPNTGGCFKGALCKLQHLPPSTDNYECRDRQEVFVYTKKFDKIVPEQYYDIEITFILALNKLIFRFADDPDYQEKLENINAIINDPKEIKTYKKISFIPEIEQLVLVKINNEFKRAKVIDDPNDVYVVWCLDEGCIITAKMSALYEWNMRVQERKYLTYEMEISNIIPINDSARGKLRLMDFQEALGCFRAMMKQTYPYLKGRLFDKDNNDIGEMLIQEGLATKNEVELTQTDFLYNEMLPA